MPDQTSVDPQPLVLSPDDEPTAAAIHPPTQSYGPGSAQDTAGSGPVPVDPRGLPGDLTIGGTGDRGGRDELAARS